jgi:hypothetical protein
MASISTFRVFLGVSFICSHQSVTCTDAAYSRRTKLSLFGAILVLTFALRSNAVGGLIRDQLRHISKTFTSPRMQRSARCTDFAVFSAILVPCVPALLPAGISLSNEWLNFMHRDLANASSRSIFSGLCIQIISQANHTISSFSICENATRRLLHLTSSLSVGSKIPCLRASRASGTLTAVLEVESTRIDTLFIWTLRFRSWMSLVVNGLHFINCGQRFRTTECDCKMVCHGYDEVSRPLGFDDVPEMLQQAAIIQSLLARAISAADWISQFN